MKKLLSIAATLMLVFSIAASAQAYPVLNWTFDFNGIGGSTTQIDRIDRLQFEARARLFTSQPNLALTTPGDRFIAQGIGVITSFLPTIGSDPVQGSLAAGEEITFFFTTEGSFTTVPTGPDGTIGFNHSNNNVGFAEIWFDTTGDADFATGVGFGDGFQIGDLDGLNRDVGTINFAASGGDRAEFSFIDVPSGVWLDEFFVDLESLLEPDLVTVGIGITDNNFDLPEAGEDALAFNAAIWNAYFGANPAGYTLQQFTLTEDGSFELSVNVVPEPSTMILSGLGLLGLGFLVRRRQTKKS